MNSPNGLIPLPTYSESLLTCIDRCEVIQKYAEDSLKGLQFEGRLAVYAAYFSIAIEHFASMILLTRQFFPASAAALARPHFESCCRGMWIYSRCTDAQVEKVFQWQLPTFPHMKEVLADIDLEYGADGTLQLFQNYWKKMCGLTHGGSEQIARRFSDSGIHANFSEEDITGTIQIVAAVSTLCLVPLLGQSGAVEKATEAQRLHASTFGWQS